MISLPYSHGRYRLVERIAQGGMAEIYRAEYNGEGGFTRTLAVKRILPQWSFDPQFRKMLKDEANLLVKLQHQNIVQVFELGEDDGLFYISMEFVDGVDLRLLLQTLRLKNERLQPKFTYWIVSDVLRALGFAHSRVEPDGFSLGIVHRDISPQNILIAYHGEVKVADFGIAKGRHRGVETTVGQLKGKLAYMSPEQARGDVIDSRSDIFSVGVLFFEMLTGTKLFDGDSDMDVLRQVQEAAIPQGWERDVAPEIRAVLRKSLKKNPDDRFQTAEEMLAALSQYVTRERCQIFGFEFAPTLEALFPKQSAPAAPVNEMVADTTHAETGYRHVQSVSRPWHTLAAALCMAFAVSPQSVDRTASSAHSHAPMPPAAAVATLLPPLPPVPRREPQEASLPVMPSEKGRLTVQVRPWGYVTIPGAISKREAPVGVSLHEGEYPVKVFHEPTSQWLTTRAHVRAGGQTLCQASFGNSPRISCR